MTIISGNSILAAEGTRGADVWAYRQAWISVDGASDSLDVDRCENSAGNRRLFGLNLNVAGVCTSRVSGRECSEQDLPFRMGVLVRFWGVRAMVAEVPRPNLLVQIEEDR
jgi:hypothetical protein